MDDLAVPVCITDRKLFAEIKRIDVQFCEIIPPKNLPDVYKDLIKRANAERPSLQSCK